MNKYVYTFLDSLAKIESFKILFDSLTKVKVEYLKHYLIYFNLIGKNFDRFRFYLHYLLFT